MSSRAITLDAATTALLGSPARTVAAPAGDMTLWRKLLLWVIGGYVLFSGPFELIRIPPVGPGVPLGELVLLASLLFMNAFALLPRMAAYVWLPPILLWWALTLPRAIFDTSSGGMWAFRDASQAIESVYLVVGFWAVNSAVRLRYFSRWFRRLLCATAIMGFLIPFLPALKDEGPGIQGAAAGSHLSIFEFNSLPSLSLIAAAYLLVAGRVGRFGPRTTRICAALLVACSAGFAQERTIYNQIVALAVVLLIFNRKAGWKWSSNLLLGAGFIGLISISGLQLTGRLGKTVSLDFIAEHLQSSTGNGGTADASDGVNLRLGWWRHINAEVLESPHNLAFGLGYGIPLTQFAGRQGVIVREPHDSYMSVWGRGGITALVTWIVVQGSLFVCWWKAYRRSKHLGDLRSRQDLLLLLCFFVMVLVYALAEDAFEKPFWAISYYFLFGVVVGHLRVLNSAIVPVRDKGNGSLQSVPTRAGQ